MAATTFTATARQGETLDALIFRVLGDGSAVLTEILDLNQNIADLGDILPEGQPVTLPIRVKAAVAARQIVQLWE